MAVTNLNLLAKKGFIWSAIERFGVQFFQISINIILARLLTPTDFGIVGMLGIFISLSQSFAQSGMAYGLIQKKNRNEIDYSTVFVFNLVVSICLYGILFLCAPWVAAFYEREELTFLTRVLAIVIVISSAGLVQNVIMRINIDFKKIAKINIISVLVSGIISVSLAYAGIGLWAIIIQILLNSFITVILSWFYSSWRPLPIFSMQSFRELFGFGYKLLLSSILATTMDNIYKIFIGKLFAPAQLGYYTQAKQYSDSSSGTLTSIVQSVSFPLLAKLQNDPATFLTVFRRILFYSSLLIFPVMSLLAISAEPLFRVILTEKWLPAVPFFQILCFARIMYPLSALNMNSLIALGRSDLFLRLDLMKFVVAIVFLLIALNFELYWIVFSSVISSSLFFIIDCFYTKQLTGYGLFKQIRDIYKIFLSCIIMMIVLLSAEFFFNFGEYILFFNFIIGPAVFILASYLMRLNLFQELKLALKK
ncbi:lipopolysaccharide biosynthesis protein [Chryseobacterium lacus]|uniref:lipopolysaccharide biosynthesis protein n=1 Tax=Chryseobacterium lacus TaxID=2058346 RepID=UPI00140C2E50|nr:lipopolysaccharide biosynthesis protein [Chryseobacterium lacus]